MKIEIDKEAVYEHVSRYLKRFVMAKRADADHVLQAYENYLAVLRTLQACGLLAWGQMDDLKFTDLELQGDFSRLRSTETFARVRLASFRKFLDSLEE